MSVQPFFYVESAVPQGRKRKPKLRKIILSHPLKQTRNNYFLKTSKKWERSLISWILLESPSSTFFPKEFQAMCLGHNLWFYNKGSMKLFFAVYQGWICLATSQNLSFQNFSQWKVANDSIKNLSLAVTFLKWWSGELPSDLCASLKKKPQSCVWYPNCCGH